MSLPLSLKYVGFMLNGSFDPRGKSELNEIGRAATEDVSQKLIDSHFFHNQIDPKSIVILTSPIKKAVQTAEILSKNLGTEAPQKREWLFSGNFREANLMNVESGIEKIAKETKAEIVMCVSHYPLIEFSVDYILKKSGHHFVLRNSLRNSDILIIDLRNFRVSILSPAVHSHHF